MTQISFPQSSCHVHLSGPIVDILKSGIMAEHFLKGENSVAFIWGQLLVLPSVSVTKAAETAFMSHSRAL